ncbi:hypothetical protein L596_025907 [Steinernema carpocapsae]|uniref:Uncharacterized protein n=1 Tax=Steinernema carpocapsae TaxID=34508 RepID=A0A4U5M964_STECR|nr:hypothetical protein L596_025907 [Steinernema carpocapsae]
MDNLPICFKEDIAHQLKNRSIYSLISLGGGYGEVAHLFDKNMFTYILFFKESGEVYENWIDQFLHKVSEPLYKYCKKICIEIRSAPLEIEPRIVSTLFALQKWTSEFELYVNCNLPSEIVNTLLKFNVSEADLLLGLSKSTFLSLLPLFLKPSFVELKARNEFVESEELRQFWKEHGMEMKGKRAYIFCVSFVQNLTNVTPKHLGPNFAKVIGTAMIQIGRYVYFQ